MFFLNLIICFLCFSYLLDNIGLMSFGFIVISYLLSCFRYGYSVFLFLLIILGFISYSNPVNLLFIFILIFVLRLKNNHYRGYLINVFCGVFFTISLLSLLRPVEYDDHFIIIILLHWIICNIIYSKERSCHTSFLAFPIIWFLMGVLLVFFLKKTVLS